MAEFNFDEEIDRREVQALKPHRIVLGADGMDLFPAGVADMDFRVAPAILDAMKMRMLHGVFGYETVPSGRAERQPQLSVEEPQQGRE